MGVIHKLKPEVIKFILDHKQVNPQLSCRSITALLLEKFQVEVSKSSINVIFKANGLSLPAGRRQKLKRRKLNLPVLPVIEGTKAITLIVQPSVVVPEQIIKPSLDAVKEELNLEEKRLQEAQEWAIKLQADQRTQAEDKLNFEKQRLKEEERKRLEEEELKAEKEKWARIAEEELKANQVNQAIAPELEPNQVRVQKESESNLVRMPGLACSGAILLKAIDCLVGGSRQINELISKSLGNPPEDFLTLTEAVIFRPLFGEDNSQIPPEKINNYYSEIKQIKAISPDIARIISNVFTQARGVKMHFIDGNIVYLDGQLHTTWPTPYLPNDFTSAVYDLKNNLNKHFFQEQPLVLLSAPGDDSPSKEFFNLLLNIGSPNKGPDILVLYGNKLEELESISLNHQNNYSLVFGLWPWQFTACRKIKRIGQFSAEHIEGINQDLYLAQIEVDLIQPATNQSVTLEGCAVKTNPEEKIRVVILNSDPSLINLNKLASIYLSRWPNLEEGFSDFNRKVEVFTYTGGAQKFFSTEGFGLNTVETSLELEKVFINYIKILDAYLRWHFLPGGYSEKDFSFANECFYKLPAKFLDSPARVTVQMQIGQEKPPLKDLEYLTRRLNECQINLSNGKILCFENAFK